MGMTETISNGRRFRWHNAEPLSKFYVGVDLGQSMDPTALSVLHHCRTPLDRGTTIRDEPGLLEQRQDVAEHFDVRHLERLPLGMSYTAIVQHVAHVLARPPLRDGAELVIDETGVGRAVGDIFETFGMSPVRISITAGA